MTCKVLEQVYKHISGEEIFYAGGYYVYHSSSVRAFLETENEACDPHRLAADSLASLFKDPVAVCLYII